MSVITKIYPLPDIDRREIERYAGIKKSDAETEALLESCLDEALCRITYKVCYTKLRVSLLPESFRELEILNGCNEAVLFAATLGLEYDRLIARCSVSSPSRALIFQAIGAERIESLCDTFCSEFENATRRFSPGYGKLCIDAQKDLFDILDPSKNIGLCLSSQFIMSPSKSVTAVFGLRS